MSFVYTPIKQKLAKADIDFDSADIRAILVMTNTTADTDQDAATISAIGTLDEYDGSGYSRPDLGASTITQDDTNNRSEIDYPDFTFGATVGAGTRSAAGMVIYVEVGADSADLPVAYIDTGGFPFAGNGGAINVTVNAEGLIQVT